MQATFSSLGRDLYWKAYAGDDGFIRWGGYDDRNWWENVAPTDHARVRVGKVTGRRFAIDFANGVVAVEEGAV